MVLLVKEVPPERGVFSVVQEEVEEWMESVALELVSVEVGVERMLQEVLSEHDLYRERFGEFD